MDPFRRIDFYDRRLERWAPAASAPRVAAGSLDLCGLIKRLSPRLDPPLHLSPYVHLLERSLSEPVEACVHSPPQHGKTETTKHALILHAIERPGLQHVYATYNHDRTLEVLESVQRIAFDAGLDPQRRAGRLRLSGETEIKFTSVEGSLTGRPVSGLAIIDDAVKDRVEAESPLQRDRVWTWFTDVLQFRRHPGSSAIVMMTRWHLDDLVGRIIREYGWRYLRMPLLADSEDDPLGREVGEVLWPEQRPLEWIEKNKFRKNVYSFAALCQGNPRPREGALFQEPTFYGALPSDGFRVGHGVDLAYSSASRSDYSVCVRGRYVASEDVLYVTRVLRRQCSAPEFAALLRQELSAAPGPMLWLASGTEKGSFQFIRQKLGRAAKMRAAVSDKYTRATPCADAWNEGRIRIPSADLVRSDPEAFAWLQDFLDEVAVFSGRADAHDDQVDALVALHAIFRKSRGLLAAINWQPPSARLVEQRYAV